MVTAQKLDNLPDQTLFGIPTNGRGWEFGQLQGDVFTQDIRPFPLQNLDALVAALLFMMHHARDHPLNDLYACR